MANGISHLFNQFAGKEVQVTETKQTFTFPAQGNMPAETFVIDEVHPKENDPVLEGMKKVAKDNGLTLRVFFPGWAGTCDLRPNRVNVNVEKGHDGKYRVSNQFSLG